jgi:hypothetical protein
LVEGMPQILVILAVIIGNDKLDWVFQAE